MAGYTPAFDSIYTGTLYGKWPTAAVWASLIPLIDARGEINLAPEAIAGMTGWPMDLLLSGIHALCQPDPRSRSKAEDGRRLVLVDPARDWGWRVVNHGLYREKARLMAKAQREVESGANKVRMVDRRRPPETAGISKGPPPTPSPYSDSNTDSEKKSEVSDTSSGGVGDASRKRSAEQRGSRLPDPFMLTAEMRSWAALEAPHVDLEHATREFCDYWRSIPGQRGRKLDWVATWRNRIRECEGKTRSRGNGKSHETIDETLSRLRKAAEAEGEPL